jgi:RNA polymerase sigma factor (sigma-70 family)
MISNILSGSVLKRLYSSELKMTNSQELLADFVKTGSEPAFHALLGRYLDLVYSSAVRLVGGDTHLAQDVTQIVFADLARKARTLPKDVMLGGWLHHHTVFVASNIMRGERRRQIRERQAVEMNTLQDHSKDNLAEVAPVLDEAIDQLDGEDRTAILLRFFEQLEFRSVGEALGSSEEAARKRVSRALERLRLGLQQRGVSLSTVALGTTLATEAVTAAPAGVAASISLATLASAATGTSTSLTVLKLMTTVTKVKLGVVGAIVAATVITPLALEHQARSMLREKEVLLQHHAEQLAFLAAENQRLSDQLATEKRQRTPRLPAPPMQASAAPANSVTADLQSTNLYDRLKDGSPKLTSEQAGAYLKANHRNAASLLAAFRTTGDPALLAEAMQKFPNDPQVAFEAAFRNDSSPEDRRQWLDALKRSDADNSFGNYLSALDFFKSGQTDQAIQELVAASAKTQFRDYTMARIQDDYEAYLSAGYPVPDAEAISSRGLLLPQLSQVKELGLDMIALAGSYRDSGDPTSAQTVLQMAASLGQRYGNTVAGETEVSRLVGMFVERAALNAMGDPNSPYVNGQTVQERMNQLAEQRQAISGLNQQMEPLLPVMTDQDWMSYKERWKLFGEEAAARWVIGKYGQQ